MFSTDVFCNHSEYSQFSKCYNSWILQISAFFGGTLGGLCTITAQIELSSVTNPGSTRNGGETGHKKGLSAARAEISEITAITGNHTANLSFLGRLASV